MRIQTFCCFIIISTMSFNALAFETHQDHFIRQKEGTTGNVKEQEYMYIACELHTVTGNVGKAITLSSRNSVQIGNDSPHRIAFGVQFSLCVRLGIRNTKCVYRNRTVQLDPNHDSYTWENLDLPITFTIPGPYKIYATTVVNNSSTQLIEMTGNASGIAFISK